MQEDGLFDEPSWDDLLCVWRKTVLKMIVIVILMFSIFQQQPPNAMTAQLQVSTLQQ